MAKKMRTLLFIVIVFLMAQPALASKEGMLPFSKFTIQSEGIDESGVIVVEGQKDSSGNYKSLSVKAFGKTIKVSKELLDKIPSKYQNGIQLSYERGYEALGDRTVYIIFLSGFTSGVRETFIISVTENGGQSILKTP